MPISAADLASLSRLLDAALDIAPPAVDAWLASLPAGQQHLVPRLRAMLAARRSDGQPAFLHSVPRLAEAPPIDVARAGELIGPYRLLRELGQGGMGAVWLAERADGSYQRQVALKLPRLAWGAGLTERMARERDIGALLEHPRIARLYDAGVDALGRPFLAFEHVDGQQLDAWCSSAQPGIAERLRLFLQVARAVAYAHGRLVVHRDLKPSNVLVTADGEAHLLDFGIAKLLQETPAGDAALTREQGRVLTPPYASPEQLRDEVITVASDVYSLGVLLYELLTGQLPYAPERRTAAAFEAAILAAEAPLASSSAATPAARKALHGELDSILAKALQRDVADRYATADALADDVERHLAGDVVLARPGTLGYRFVKTLRRHRSGFAAGAAVLAAVLAGAGVAVVQAQRANAEAAHAIDAAARARVVKDFVVNVFKAGSAEGGGEARRLPVELLVDRGARLIGTQFVAQPDIRAELYGVVARILLDVRADPLALDYANKAVQALDAAKAPTDARAEGALLRGEALAANLKSLDAEKAARDALAQAHDVSIQVQARLLLADLMRLTSRYSGAFEQLDQVDQALAGTSSAAPLSRTLEARALYLRAGTLVSTNHFDQARPIFERAITTALAAEGPSSRLLSKIRFGFANRLVYAGFVEPARAIYKEAFDAMRATGGEDDIEAAIRQADTAEILASAGAIGFDEANASIRQSEQTLERQGARVPPWVRADVESTHSCLALRFGRVDEGYALAAHSTPVLRAAAQVPSTSGCLGFASMMSGRHAQAEEEFMKEIAEAVGADTTAHWAAHSYVTLAFNRLMNGQPREALEALDSAPQFPKVNGAMESMADVASMSIRVARARIGLQQQHYAAVLQLLDGVPDQKFMMNDAGFIRGQALCHSGKPREGVALMRLRMKLREGIGGYVFSPWVAHERARLGLCELAAGHRARAEALAQQARAAFVGQPGVSPFYKADSVELDRRLQRTAAR